MVGQNVFGVSVNVTGAGDHVLYPATSGGLKVWRILLTCDKTGSAPVQIQFKSGTTSQPGPIDLVDGGSVSLGMERRRWVMVQPGEDLVLNLSVDATIKGALTIEDLT